MTKTLESFVADIRQQATLRRDVYRAVANPKVSIDLYFKTAIEACNEIEQSCTKLKLLNEMRDQLLHDAANLRDYATAAEPFGVANVMVEVAEHLEELCGNQQVAVARQKCCKCASCRSRSRSTARF